MKRYIKAAFSGTAPEWLIKDFSRGYGGIKQALMKKKKIAIDHANFLDAPTGGNCLPIYLLKTDYGTEIYCPGVNDDDTGYFNNRNRRLGSLAKSRLPELAVDVVYVDLSDPANLIEKKERYQDPRYSYRNSRHGSYAGQYKRKDYLGRDENGDEQYSDEYWTKSGMTPSNESRARDKSGYTVPSPSEMIAQYYSKFPDKITKKVDRIYDRISEVKTKLLSGEFNKPISRGSRDVYREAYRKFSDVVGDYHDLFDYFNAAGKLKEADLLDGDGYYVNQMSSIMRNISQELSEIENLIAE